MILIHFISKEQIEHLEQIFAILTPSGWVIPDWINDLKLNVRN